MQTACDRLAAWLSPVSVRGALVGRASESPETHCYPRICQDPKPVRSRAHAPPHRTVRPACADSIALPDRHPKRAQKPVEGRCSPGNRGRSPQTGSKHVKDNLPLLPLPPTAWPSPPAFSPAVPRLGRCPHTHCPPGLSGSCRGPAPWLLPHRCVSVDPSMTPTSRLRLCHPGAPMGRHPVGQTPSRTSC